MRQRAAGTASAATRMLVALLVACVAVLWPPAPASAHTVGGVGATNFHTTLSALSPAVPGLDLRVVENGSRLQLSNDTAAPVVVQGYQGEAYARVGPDGVFLNDNSPATYLNSNRYGTASVPAGVDPKQPPKWRKISGDQVFRWHDHRIHWMLTTLPPAVAAAPAALHTISTWTVALDYQGATLSATGRLDWVPGPAPWGWLVLAALLAMAVAVAGTLPGWRRWLAGATAALVGADILHGAGIALVTAGTLPERLGAFIGSDATELLVWLVGGLAALLLARGRLGATWLAAAAGLLVAVNTGLIDMPALWRSSAPTGLPLTLDRLTVVAALGPGVGLLAALPLALRRHRTAPTAPSSLTATAGPTADPELNADELSPALLGAAKTSAAEPNGGSLDPVAASHSPERPSTPSLSTACAPAGDDGDVSGVGVRASQTPERAGAVGGGIQRRQLIGYAAASGLGGLVGAAAVAGTRVTAPAAAPPSTGTASGAAAITDVGARRVPFHGRRQAGIATPAGPQAYSRILAFDLVPGVDRDRFRELLRGWSAAAAALTTATSLGGGPASLTVTVGFGPSLFGKAGLPLAQRPAALTPLPAFPGDHLEAARSDGDLGVVVCADDPIVVFNTARALRRLAPGMARLRWEMTGFSRARGVGADGSTPRNLMGQLDGIHNPKPDEPDFDARIFVPADAGPAWLRDGSYLVVRRIRMLLDDWDRLEVPAQERIVGRRKDSGAPLSGGTEQTLANFGARGPDGALLIPATAHMRLATPAFNNGAAMLRRGFSYADGTRSDGSPDAGLIFLAWQADPRKGFIPVQQRLSTQDSLGRFIRHESSALFAMPGGAAEGEYLGQQLLEA